MFLNGPYKTHPHFHGPLATRQHKSPRVGQKNWSWRGPLFYEAEMLQILGHDIPLARGPQKNGPPQPLVGMGTA